MQLQSKVLRWLLIDSTSSKVSSSNYAAAPKYPSNIFLPAPSRRARRSKWNPSPTLLQGCHGLSHIFPQVIEEDASADEGFTIVQSRKSSKQSQANPISLKETFNKLSEHINFSIDENDRYYIIIGRRGDRRSVNIYFKYKDAIYGAHHAYHAVSGAYIMSFHDINDAWARIECRFPGVNSFDALRKFHEGIPHTETNMSPTWSDVDDKTFHQFGSVAYTYTEADDADLLLK